MLFEIFLLGARWAVIELWPSRDWAVTSPWPSLAVTIGPRSRDHR